MNIMIRRSQKRSFLNARVFDVRRESMLKLGNANSMIYVD